MRNVLNKLRTTRSDGRGITLIELVITVAVIGILAAIFILAYGMIQNTARHNSVKKVAKDVYIAALAQSTNGGDPQDAHPGNGLISAYIEGTTQDDLIVWAWWTEDEEIMYSYPSDGWGGEGEECTENCPLDADIWFYWNVFTPNGAVSFTMTDNFYYTEGGSYSDVISEFDDGVFNLGESFAGPEAPSSWTVHFTFYDADGEEVATKSHTWALQNMIDSAYGNEPEPDGWYHINGGSF